jgi:hypothetical protein
MLRPGYHGQLFVRSDDHSRWCGVAPRAFIRRISGKVFYGIMVFGFALIFIFYWKAWAYAFLELLELTLVSLFSALSMTVLVCLAFYMLFFIFSSITGVAGADPPGIDTLAYYVLVVTLFLQLVMAGWVAFR